MTTTGSRELRQQASDLVRRAEGGEILTVTVSGRAVATLGPLAPPAWRTWSEVAEVFAGAADRDGAQDRDLVDQAPLDPFTR